jgi:hexokinase
LHSTHAHEEKPHATKKDMATYLRRYEQLFTITPQRMRMIVRHACDDHGRPA